MYPRALVVGCLLEIAGVLNMSYVDRGAVRVELG